MIYGRYVGESWHEDEEPNLESALGHAYLDYEQGLAVPHEIRLGSTVYDRQAILGLLYARGDEI